MRFITIVVFETTARVQKGAAQRRLTKQSNLGQTTCVASGLRAIQLENTDSGAGCDDRFVDAKALIHKTDQ